MPAGESMMTQWAIGVIEVHAARAASRIQLTRIELFGADGKVHAVATRELQLRIAPTDPPYIGRHSRGQTVAFGGEVPANSTLRLWFHGRLDGDFSRIFEPKVGGGAGDSYLVRYRIELQTSAGDRIHGEGLADQWSTR